MVQMLAEKRDCSKKGSTSSGTDFTGAGFKHLLW